MNAPLHREMPAALLDSGSALAHATEQWDRDIVKQLTDYIAIPAKSPGFDKEWQQHRFIETVVRNAAAWIEAQKRGGVERETRPPGSPTGTSRRAPRPSAPLHAGPTPTHASTGAGC